MTSILKNPILGQFNQGALFTCAKAERYPHCEVSGIVLTARCDIEQDKFNVLNYAPVVRLVDWLAADGYDICVSRASADFMGRVSKALKSVELPESLLHSQSLSSILETVIRDPDASKTIRKTEPAFVELVRIGGLLSKYSTGTARSNPDFHEHLGGLVRSVIKELMNHKLSGYYYLPAIDASSKQEGYVALLREVTYPHRASAPSEAQ